MRQRCQAGRTQTPLAAAAPATVKLLVVATTTVGRISNEIEILSCHHDICE